MGFLKPTNTYNANGVTVKVRIIPMGVKATKSVIINGKTVIKQGGNFKADRLLAGGKPADITIHNTEPITPATGTTSAEQYSRAMYPNENLADVRVHFFTDDKEAWQNLQENEVGFHAGTTANNTSLAIEIIGKTAKAEDNGARLAAYLLHKYGLSIDHLKTHKYYTGKYCPAYILPHWDSFKAKVKAYLANLGEPATATPAKPEKRACSSVYKSLGAARIRSAPSLTGEEKGKCVVGGYYAIAAIVTAPDGKKWIEHLNGGYSALTDTDGSELFSYAGTFKRTVTTARCNVRKEPTIKATRIVNLTANTNVIHFIGGEKVADGITWVRILNNKMICWADKQWVRV